MSSNTGTAKQNKCTQNCHTDKNIEYNIDIIAGKKALAQAKAGKLQELKAIAETSDKQEDVQAYRDFEDL